MRPRPGIVVARRQALHVGGYAVHGFGRHHVGVAGVDAHAGGGAAQQHETHAEPVGDVGDLQAVEGMSEAVDIMVVGDGAAARAQQLDHADGGGQLDFGGVEMAPIAIRHRVQPGCQGLVDPARHALEQRLEQVVVGVDPAGVDHAVGGVEHARAVGLGQAAAHRGDHAVLHQQVARFGARGRAGKTGQHAGGIADQRCLALFRLSQNRLLRLRGIALFPGRIEQPGRVHRQLDVDVARVDGFSSTHQVCGSAMYKPSSSSRRMTSRRRGSPLQRTIGRPLQVIDADEFQVLGDFVAEDFADAAHQLRVAAQRITKDRWPFRPRTQHMQERRDSTEFLQGDFFRARRAQVICVNDRAARCRGQFAQRVLGAATRVSTTDSSRSTSLSGRPALRQRPLVGGDAARRAVGLAQGPEAAAALKSTCNQLYPGSASASASSTSRMMPLTPAAWCRSTAARPVFDHARHALHRQRLHPQLPCPGP